MGSCGRELVKIAVDGLYLGLDLSKLGELSLPSVHLLHFVGDGGSELDDMSLNELLDLLRVGQAVLLAELLLFFSEKFVVLANLFAVVLQVDDVLVSRDLLAARLWLRAARLWLWATGLRLWAAWLLLRAAWLLLRTARALFLRAALLGAATCLLLPMVQVDDLEMTFTVVLVLNLRLGTGQLDQGLSDAPIPLGVGGAEGQRDNCEKK